uniref:(California timema) hypothetical protein n=1 Tax=Timema californicum TaxID=61474 RepID=A0A7R9J655_TIMCA|nr:unnamed protein product [Timema californicum]
MDRCVPDVALTTQIPAAVRDSDYRPWCCSDPGTTMSSCRWRPGTLRKAVRRNIPILTWLPKYNLDTFVSDLIAGVTVGLTVMPQGLAYATLAGLEPQVCGVQRLYSAAWGNKVVVPLGATTAAWGNKVVAPLGATTLQIRLGQQRYRAAWGNEAIALLGQQRYIAAFPSLLTKYGLYSAFMGCFVYLILGSCKDITIGPTALMALMTYQQVVGRNPDFAVLLCFLSGCVQLLMSVLHLGVLVDFISIPVTVGFTSATSVIIAVSQLKGLLGLSFTSSGFVDNVKKVYQQIGETRLGDTVLGGVCIVILLLLRKLKDVKLGPKDDKPSERQRVLMKILWLVSTSRNALVVIVCSVLAFTFHTSEKGLPFLLTGNVRSGLPPFGLPPFSTVIGNQSYSFVDMCSELGSSIVLVPIIAVLGNVAIAKAFASGHSVNATQELLTLGLCNILGSFVSSMPVTGSFSRSAVNHASGVKTPLGGLYTGVLILLALSLLTPYFYFIPKASLAAVIICAVIFMIEYEVVQPMWKSSRKDLIPTFATFLLCLMIGVEYGILVGVGINIVFLLYPSARPTIHVERKTTHSGKEYLMVTPGNSLYFPAVDFIRTNVGRVGVKQGSSQLPVIVDCRFILGADFTAAKGIAALIDDFHKRKQPIYFYNPSPEVVSVFKGANLEEFVHIRSEEELDFILQAHVEMLQEGCPDENYSMLPALELKEITTSVANGTGHYSGQRPDTVGSPVDDDYTRTPLLKSSAPRAEIRKI